MRLRDYQQDAVNSVLEDMTKPKPSKGVMVLGTGTGKSYVIAGLAKAYKGPILVLQPSKELLSQNAEKYRLLGGEYSIYSASLKTKEVGHVTFGTLGSVIKAIDQFKVLKDLLIIADECHYKYNPQKDSQFRRFIDGVKPKFSYGLTATPFRMHNSMQGSTLKMITRTRPGYFNKIIYVQQISEAIDLGFWSPSINERWKYDKSLLEYNSTGSEYSEVSMRKANESNSVNKNIAARLIQLIKEGKRKSILVFTDSVKSAEIFTEYFKKHTTAGMVAGKTKAKERDAFIEGFKDGSVHIIFNYGTLTTGFDHPELDCVVMGRPTNSLSMFYQIYGRGCRVADGKIDWLFVDACDNFGNLCHPRDIVIEDHPQLGWTVFAGERVITGVILGVPIYKKDLLEANTPGEDLGIFPIGKYKGRKIMEICERDSGYATWFVKNCDTEKYGPALKNKFEAGLKRVALANLIKK